MVRFECPQCDRRLTAHPGAAGRRCKCPTCWGQCVIPGAGGQPATIVRSVVALSPYTQPTSNADNRYTATVRGRYPHICMCCGRDTARCSLYAITTGGLGIGGRAAVFVAEAVLYAVTGAALFTDHTPSKVELTLRVCEGCESAYRRVLNVERIDLDGIHVSGVASRFVNEEVRKADEVARGFERAMEGRRPAEQNPGGGFDWSSLQ